MTKPTRQKQFDGALPYFQWYVNDLWLDQDFILLSTKAQGIYIHIIRAVFNSSSGRIPADIKALLRLIGKQEDDADAVEEVLAILPSVGAHHVTLNWIEAGKQDARDRMQRRRDSARMAARARWQNGEEAVEA